MPSLARSVPKLLKVPCLARSVHKPLKVPTLARSVPMLLKTAKAVYTHNRAFSAHRPLTSVFFREKKSARENWFFGCFWVFSRAKTIFHVHFFPDFSRPLFIFTDTLFDFFHG